MTPKGKVFGPTDCGIGYIAKWFSEHECSVFCKKDEWMGFDADKYRNQNADDKDNEEKYEIKIDELYKPKRQKRTTYSFESVGQHCNCGGTFKTQFIENPDFVNKGSVKKDSWYEKQCLKCGRKLPVFDIRDDDDQNNDNMDMIS